MERKISITDVGFRDGIQALQKIIPTQFKIDGIEALVRSGIKNVEVASFVHPKKVPNMADAEKVCNGLKMEKDVNYIGLVLNEKGLERAINTPINTIQSILYATETFAQKNAGFSIDESKKSFQKIISKAKKNGLRVVGAIAVAFGCRYEGRVDESVVFELIDFLLGAKVDVISLADSTGMAHPNQIDNICEQALEMVGDTPLNLHLHDTESKGYANLLTGLRVGVRNFDTAFGGMGGCPFIPNASGNIGTEDTVHLLHQLYFDTGIDMNQVAALSKKMEELTETSLSGKMYQLIHSKTKL